MFIFNGAFYTRFYDIQYTRISLSENEYQYTAREGFTLYCKSSARLDVWENDSRQSLHMKAVFFVWEHIFNESTLYRKCFTANITLQEFHLCEYEYESQDLFSEKMISYIRFIWMVSHLWIRTCLVRCDLREKDYVHMVHLNGFSFVWIRICFAGNGLRQNDFINMLHVNGFSFGWERICSASRELRENDLVHMVHTNGFPVVWEGMCLTSFDLKENNFALMTHVNGFH